MSELRHGTYLRGDRVDSSSQARSWPLFEMQTYKDEGASAREGRAIFRSREIVKIMMPGNSLNIPAALVTDEHRERWPREYQAFKAGTEISAEGMPLEEVPWLNRAMVLELKYLNFRTLEELAVMDDRAIQRIGMGGRMLKEKAQAWLDSAAEAALMEKLTSERAAQDEKISLLSRQVEELGALCTKLNQELIELKGRPDPIVATAPMDMKAAQVGPSEDSPAPSALDGLSRAPVKRRK